MKKQKLIHVITLIIIGLSALFINSCKKEKDPQVPVLTTFTLSDIKQTMADCGGNISSDGGFPVSSSGICWSTDKAPTIDNYKAISDTKTGFFTGKLTNLIPNTVYYVRAYATNSEGTGYGNELSFTTLPALLPTLATITPNSITETTGISGGIISDDGGVPVTSRGICWSTIENPTIALATKTVSGSGTGSFTSSLDGLIAGVLYYVRAYATNSVGTSYGAQRSLRSDPAYLMDADGNAYRTITIGTQTWMEENLKTTTYNDGSPIPNVKSANSWALLITGAYCWYSDAITNKNIYGALYNYYAVADSRGLSPTGWHIATKEEWATLVAYVGGESIAGVKLMESGPKHWKPGNIATNESGFTALPGGDRYRNDYYYIEFKGSWWTATEFDSSNAWSPAMASSYQDVRIYENEKSVGLSVRCVKD